MIIFFAIIGIVVVLIVALLVIGIYVQAAGWRQKP